MNSLTVEKNGPNLAIYITPEEAAELQIQPGDRVYLTKAVVCAPALIESEQITKGTPEWEKAIAAYQVISQKYKNALRELAK